MVAVEVGLGAVQLDAVAGPLAGQAVGLLLGQDGKVDGAHAVLRGGRRVEQEEKQGEHKGSGQGLMRLPSRTLERYDLAQNISR